ncbi:MAG: MobF family relaxase [Gammaproteobacteria bacterium]
MLSISARGSAVTAAAYYEHLSTGRGAAEALEDYYAKEQSGRWLGTGARAFGLHGEVSESEFLALARGFDMQGEALTQNAGEERHRAGWDLTFSAPKSVSVVWGLADEETRTTVAKAHDEAVSEAVGYIERHASFSRIGHAGEREVAAGLVIAAYRHGTSRAQDPQLHTHAFAMNVGVRDDGTTGTLQSRHFYVWQKAAGAAYRVALSERLQALGYEVERDGESFRLTAVPREVEREFSTRRTEIERALAERGLSGARAAEKAALDTRQAKEIRDFAVLSTDWQERAAPYELGWHPDNTLPREHGYERDVAVLAAPLVDRDAVRHKATEHQATFSEAQAHTVLFVEMQGKAGLDSAEREARALLENDPGVIRLEAAGPYAKGARRYTTPEMRRLEEAMVERSGRMADRRDHAVSDQALDAALTVYPTLSEEQHMAVVHIACASGDIALVQGVAGAGKSFALGAARTAWETEGYTVHGLALSGKAAQEIECGSDIPSMTLSAFFGDNFIENDAGEVLRVDTERHNLDGRLKGRSAPAERLTPRDVVVLDEAGMVGSRQMNRLLAVCGAAGSKLVLVGDTRQLQAIEAGAAFRVIQERVGVVTLEENRRQALWEDREAVALLRAGNAEAALESLAKRGRMSIAPNAREAKEEMGRALAEDLAEGKEALGITATRQDTHDVNQAARARARELGAIQGEEVAAVTRYGERPFAAGERVMFGRNVNGDDRAAKMGGMVKNGERGTVRRAELLFERGHADGVRLSIELDRGGERTVDTRHYDWIDHGYAATAHKAQGATVDRTHVLATEASMPTGREWGYVAASRHRESLHVYSDAASIEELAPEWSRAHPKDATLDYNVFVDREQSATEVVELGY